MGLMPGLLLAYVDGESRLDTPGRWRPNYYIIGVKYSGRLVNLILGNIECDFEFYTL